MPLKLKNPSTWPSGGFPFTDPRTGKVFNAMSADLTLQAKNVIAHRKANPRIYSEAQFFHMDAVKQEILQFMCAKRPEICVETDRIAPTTFVASKKKANLKQVSPPQGKRCYKCGGNEFTPEWCKTCGGHKVRAWICVKCNTSNPK